MDTMGLGDEVIISVIYQYLQSTYGLVRDQSTSVALLIKGLY